MTAGDHLSDQFEVVQPHRLVRIGGRTYPAAHTINDPGDASLPSITGAHIPMENGQLLRVLHFGDQPGTYLMHAPMKKDAHLPGAGSVEPNHPLRDQYGQMRPFLKVHGTELATKMIDAESTRPLNPEEHEAARAQLQRLRKKANG